MNRNRASPQQGRLATWLGKRRLRAASRVGSGARLLGRADIGGGGEILIGDRFLLASRPSRSHLFALPGGRLTIGNDVRIAQGAAISAHRSIAIGDNTLVGPFVVIMDNDYHRAGDRNAAGEMAPVRIGSNVQIGARVTILRGSVIGDDVKVMSGSMVSGAVPAGATIGGVPARVMGAATAATSELIDMAGLVQSVLGLAERPADEAGPDQIPGWDSLGVLRLLLAIEDTYGISVEEDEIGAGRNIATLAAIVEAKLRSISAPELA